jgi:hypothetical protein
LVIHTDLFLLEIEGIETNPTQGLLMVQGAIAGAQLGTVAGAWSTLGDKQHWQRVWPLASY